MIEFNISNVQHACGSRNLSIDNRLKAICYIESSFEFRIDNCILIDEEDWNIVEFVDQLTQWKNAGLSDSFSYNCMDIEENDIFVFKRDKGNLYFTSSWAKNKYTRVLMPEEVSKFIDEITNATFHMVLCEMKINLKNILYSNSY